MPCIVRSRISSLIAPVLLLIGAALIVASNTLVTFTVLVVAAVAVVMAAVLSSVVHRPNAWPGWLLAGIGGGLTLGGRAVSSLTSDAVPSPKHPLELIGSLAALAGLFLVARAKRTARDDQGTLDAAILAVAAVGVIWQAAYGAASKVAANDNRLALYAPLALVLAAVALARLLFAANRPYARGPLLASCAFSLASSQMIVALALPDTNPFSGQTSTALLVAGWGMFAAILSDPSIVALSEPALRPRAGISTSRLAVLALGLLAAGVATEINQNLDRGVDLDALVLCSSLAGLLVLTRVVGLVHDVERSRQAARQRDRWYRQLVRHSADVLFVIDADQRLRFASPAIEVAVGQPPGEVLGRALYEFIHPDDTETFSRAVQHLRSSPPADQVDGPPHVQVRLLHVDGSIRWVDLSLSDRLDDRSIDGIVVNARDVTIKKRQEAELQKVYEKQAAIAALGRAALAGIEPGQLAAEAVRQIQRTLGADGCELYKLLLANPLTSTPATLLLEAATGALADKVGEYSIPVEPDTQAGYAMGVGETCLSNDLESEQRFSADRLITDLGLASSASVLVKGHSQAYGVLTVTARRRNAFGHQDLSFLTTMANELALALERRSAEEQTRHQALHDSLTGLANRVLFLDRLNLVTARNDARSKLIGVLFLDLDYFKVVNDSLGHEAGDALLKQVAERLRKAMRPTDLVARFGGDEFVVLCEELETIDQARNIAARVRENMTPPFVLEGNEVHVSASIGIAVTGATSDAEALLRDADAAMYKAKERGRGRYEVFDFTMRDQAMARLQTESALHRAISERQLVVHYQPIVRLHDHATIGVEALVRWDHPEWGLLPPQRFIPIAEKSGLIDAVSEYVLAEACRDMAKWQERMGSQLDLVSVNLSASQLSQANLARRVGELLAEHGASPTKLCLEITESAVMLDTTRSMKVLAELRDLGVRIAVDDFGTGYSSLAYLRKLPLDILKIDREFTRGLASSMEDRAIAHTIITLAHRLGLMAIGEGVEMPEQVAELMALECDFVQGYHFGEAVAADLVRWERRPITLS